MTEAGWTSKKPIVAGWYWWRGKEESGIALVFPADKPMPWHTSDHSARVQLFYSAGGMSSTRVNDFGGEWLGPISPTDRQGWVACLGDVKRYVERQIKIGEDFIGGPDPNIQRRVALDEVIEYCDRQLAQAAQDEKEVGDAEN